MLLGVGLYLMLCTHPDIRHAVTKLSQFTANPSQDHLDRACSICRYLAGVRATCKLRGDGTLKRVDSLERLNKVAKASKQQGGSSNTEIDECILTTTQIKVIAKQ